LALAEVEVQKKDEANKRANRDRARREAIDNQMAALHDRRKISFSAKLLMVLLFLSLAFFTIVFILFHVSSLKGQLNHIVNFLLALQW
jgi:hypothetical protein